jgi:hypothetical protein
VFVGSKFPGVAWSDFPAHAAGAISNAAVDSRNLCIVGNLVRISIFMNRIYANLNILLLLEPGAKSEVINYNF